MNEADGFFLDIYRRQVEVADQHLAPIYHFLTQTEQNIQAMNEHFRKLGLAEINLCNEFSLSVEQGAFLIVERPLAYEAYVMTQGGPEILSSGIKEFHDVVRFEDFKVRAARDGEQIVPQVEIIESRPVGEKVLGREVYNHLVFNPLDHRIAFAEMYTPQLTRLS